MLYPLPEKIKNSSVLFQRSFAMRQGLKTPGGLSDLPKIFRIQKSLHYSQVLGVNQFPVS